MLRVGELQVQVFYTAVGASHHSNYLVQIKDILFDDSSKEVDGEDVSTGTNSSDFQLVVLLSTSCQLLVSTAGGLVERVDVRLAEWAR